MDPELLALLMGVAPSGPAVDPRMLDPVGALSGGASPAQPSILPGMGAGSQMPQPPLSPPVARPAEPYMSQLPPMSDLGAGGTLPATQAPPSIMALGMGAGGALPTPQAAPPVPMPAAGPNSLGAALEPNPTGYGTNPWSSGGVLAPGAGGAAKPGGGDALLKTLRGVQAPAAPVPQKVSTPHAPQVAKIQGGALADLLASLGIGPQQALPGLKLPSTLGQALGGR